MTSIVKGLFGGRSSAEKILGQFQPTTFSSPGLSSTLRNNRLSVARGSEAEQALADLRAGFSGQGTALRTGADNLGAFLPQLQDLQRRLGALEPSTLSPELRDLRTRLQGVDLSSLASAQAGLAGLQPGLATNRAGIETLARSLGTDVAGLRTGLTGLRGEVSSLRDRLRPGFGDLTRSRVEELRNNRTRAVGNLREELSRRRVLGSSFALREVDALESEFSRQEDLVRAESMLQELDANNQLIAQELGIVGAEAGLVQSNAAQQAQLLAQQAGISEQEADLITRGAGIASQEAAIRMGLIDQETGLVSEEFRQHMEVVDSEMQRVAAEGGLISQQAGIVGTQFETVARAFDTAIISAQQVLAQLNLETGLAAGLSESASSLLQANLTAQAQARSAQEAGAAEFLGTIIGMFTPTGGKTP